MKFARSAFSTISPIREIRDKKSLYVIFAFLPSVKSVQSVAWDLCSLRVLLYSALTSGLVFEIYAFL
jgi:hypothetical protein